jgi:hypothetical protein
MRGVGEDCGVLTTAPCGLPCAAPRTRVPPRCGRRTQRAPGPSHGASGVVGLAPRARGAVHCRHGKALHDTLRESTLLWRDSLT